MRSKVLFWFLGIVAAVLLLVFLIFVPRAKAETPTCEQVPAEWESVGLTADWGVIISFVSAGDGRFYVISNLVLRAEYESRLGEPNASWWHLWKRPREKEMGRTIGSYG